MRGVYLLAFVRRGEHVAYGASSATPHAGAAHYLGYAEDIAERVREHATGRGSRLTLAVWLAGYELRLVRVWPGATRETERAIKTTHNLGRACPLCRYHLDTAPIALPAPLLAEELLGPIALTLSTNTRSA